MLTRNSEIDFSVWLVTYVFNLIIRNIGMMQDGS